MEQFKGAANRSYYCIFHAMRAVLALEKFDSKKHSGVISAFRKNYIRAGFFPAEFSDIIGKAFEVRNGSDYQDFYLIPKEKVETQIANAKIFLAARRVHCKKSDAVTRVNPLPTPAKNNRGGHARPPA